MKNKAQELSFLSVQYAQASNKEAWLSLFAADAVVQDPVGKSPLDLLGNGHKGIEAIGAFYDKTIATRSLSIEILDSFPAGDECANRITLTNADKDHSSVKVDMIVVYKTNEHGKLNSLKAYWAFDEL